MGGWRAAGERPSECIWKVDPKGILLQRSFQPVTGILGSQDFHLLTVVCPCRERLSVDCDAQAGARGCGWPCVGRLGLDCERCLLVTGRRHRAGCCDCGLDLCDIKQALEHMQKELCLSSFGDQGTSSMLTKLRAQRVLR